MVRLRVNEAAREKGINMARLARRADLDYRTIRCLFHNPYRDVTLSTLEKISDALEVPIANLIVQEPKKGKQISESNRDGKTLK